MGNKKILIVDDDPDVLQSMHVRLKANHYDTFFAADAISCMAEARKNEPDLILLDLGLPAGDGFPDHGAIQSRTLSRLDPGHRDLWPRPSRQPQACH